MVQVFLFEYRVYFNLNRTFWIFSLGFPDFSKR